MRALAGSGGSAGVTVDAGDGDGDGDPDKPLHKEAYESYLAYAMAVLVGRALPDARDGLKPVHRRILFCMRDLGLSSDKPHRKSARIVGDVLGKLHPHGDNALYDALVRMVQPFSLSVPMIDGHGNFGSVDADPPAAMRYTECRLQSATENIMLEGLNEDAVPFKDTYDGQMSEPSVLPAALPMLLVNGTYGIAVGMNSCVPTHNLEEVANVAIAYARDPSISDTELMRLLPAPDFPTGGEIIDEGDVLGKLYTTGRAQVTVRGRVEIETVKNRTSIVIKDLPYKVNKAALVGKIAELADEGAMEGIASVRDESDREGMRVAIDLKKKAPDPMLVVNNLYKATALQSTTHCNMVALWNGKPQLMTLRNLLDAWLSFRKDVIRRRAAHRRRVAEDKLHIVEGYLAAIERIDDVIETIRKSEGADDAKTGIADMLGATETQAKAILALPLRRLARLDTRGFEEDASSLRAEIGSLTQLLDSDSMVVDAIVKDAQRLTKLYGTPRRTEIREGKREIAVEDVVANDPCVLLLTKKGYIKRVRESAFKLQGRRTKGAKGSVLADSDSIRYMERCNVHDTVLFFTSEGRCYGSQAVDVPELGRNAKGAVLTQVLNQLPANADVTAMLTILSSDLQGEGHLVLFTQRGFVKRVERSQFLRIQKTGRSVINLEDGDKLTHVLPVSDDDSLCFASKQGKVVHCLAASIRPTSLVARGVLSMILDDDDGIAGLAVIHDGKTIMERGRHGGGPWLLLSTKRGYLKRMSVTDFRLSQRRAVGLIGYKFLKKKKKKTTSSALQVNVADDEILSVLVVENEDSHVFLASKEGIMKRASVHDFAPRSRMSAGLPAILLPDDDSLVSLALSDHDDDDEDETTTHTDATPS